MLTLDSYFSEDRKRARAHTHTHTLIPSSSISPAAPYFFTYPLQTLQPLHIGFVSWSSMFHVRRSFRWRSGFRLLGAFGLALPPQSSRPGVVSQGVQSQVVLRPGRVGAIRRNFRTRRSRYDSLALMYFSSVCFLSPMTYFPPDVHPSIVRRVPTRIFSFHEYRPFADVSSLFAITVLS